MSAKRDRCISCGEMVREGTAHIGDHATNCALALEWITEVAEAARIAEADRIVRLLAALCDCGECEAPAELVEAARKYVEAK